MTVAFPPPPPHDRAAAQRYADYMTPGTFVVSGEGTREDPYTYELAPQIPKNREAPPQKEDG